MDHQVAAANKLAERYLLNELSSPQREDFEEHFFSCVECAEEVRLGAAFVENAKVVLTEKPAEQRVDRRQGWFAWLWSPVPAYALAGLMLVFGLQQRLTQTPGLQAELITPVALRPATRGDAQVVPLRQGQKVIEVHADVSAGVPYVCEFRNAAGETVVRMETPALQSNTLTFLLPADKFPEGRYTLVIRGQARTAAAQPFEEEYRFLTQK